MRLRFIILWCKFGEVFWGGVAFICKKICLFIEKHYEINKI